MENRREIMDIMSCSNRCFTQFCIVAMYVVQKLGIWQIFQQRIISQILQLIPTHMWNFKFLRIFRDKTLDLHRKNAKTISIIFL